MLVFWNFMILNSLSQFHCFIQNFYFVYLFRAALCTFLELSNGIIGAMKFNLITLNIMTLSIPYKMDETQNSNSYHNTLHPGTRQNTCFNGMLCAAMLLHYAKYGYSECRYTECGYADCHYAECHSETDRIVIIKSLLRVIMHVQLVLKRHFTHIYFLYILFNCQHICLYIIYMLGLYINTL